MTTTGTSAFDGFEGGTDGDAPYLQNQSPAPSAVDVALDTHIYKEVVDDDTGVVLAEVLFRVKINSGSWQVAYDGSTDTFGTGFDGAASLRSAASPNGYTINIDLTSDLSLGDVVQMEVTAKDGVNNTLGPVITQFQALTPPYFTLRDPAPSDTAVAYDADVTVRARDEGSGINESTYLVKANFGHGSGLETVYDGNAGGFQGSFAGTYTEIAAGLEYEVKLTTHPGFFEGIINLEAYVEDNAGAILSDSWTFTTVLIAPTIHPIDPVVSGYTGSDKFLQVEFRDVGGSGVNKDTIDYDLSGPAVVNGVVQSEYIGMLTENSENSGWDLKIKPRTAYDVGEEVDADASCEDF